MGALKQIFDNTITIIGGNLIFRILSLVLVIYLARYLDVSSFGQYNFIFSYLEFFNIFIDLGLGAILVREMSRDYNSMPKIVGNAHLIKLILSVIAIILSISIMHYTNYANDTKQYVYFASSILFFRAFSDTYRNVFQTMFKMKYDIISKLIFKIISILLVILLIHLGGTLFQIIIAIALSELLKTIINHIFSAKLIRATFDIDYKLWSYLFKESLPIAMSSIFLVVYSRVDVLMLSFMKGDFDVGIYSAAFRLSEPFGLLSFALISSLFPLMSKYFETSNGMLEKTFTYGLKYLFILMLPLSIIISIFSDEVISLIYSSSFESASISLQVLIWATFFSSMNYFLSFLLISINKQRTSTSIMGICVVINILLNLLLIPVYTYEGASFATLMTETILFSFYFLYVIREFGNLSFDIFYKPLISSLFMVICIWVLQLFDIVFYFEMMCGIFIYIVFLLVFNTFTNEEIRRFKMLPYK